MSANTIYVVSADPGKNYGYVVWEIDHSDGSYHPLHAQVLCQDDGIPYIPYDSSPGATTLLCEGTSFGYAAKYIQRCVGRLEGALGVVTATVPVAVWRKAVYTKKEYANTVKKRSSGSKKWKDLAVAKCEELGYKLPDRKDAHHLAEAYLIGHAFIYGLIPEKKINGLTKR